MATTLAAATLTITINESVTINGKNKGDSSIITISGIKEVLRRTVTVTTTETNLVYFPSNLAALGSVPALCGAFDSAKVRYMRITNKDDTNHVMLTFKDEDNTEFRIKVDAGHSFIYPGDNSGGVVDTMKANGSALASGLADLYLCTADADTASCDIEVYVAIAS